MSESKFHKMEKRIAALEKEIQELRVQLLTLALQNSPQIVPLPQPINVPYWPPYYPLITCGNDNVYDDGYKIMCESVNRVTGN
jgi:hypothetical protein